MSGGSANSNLGYGNMAPFSIVNGNFVNKFSSNNPANFGTNEIPGLPGLAGAKNNVDAAAGIVPGLSFRGGAKAFKRKIKNITKRYKKMGKSLKRNIKSLRKNLRSRMAQASASLAGGRRRRRSCNCRKSCNCRNRRKSRKQRGGYAQFQNNQPFYNSYSVGGILSANESALANPAPILKISNEAVDNLNAYTMKGFQSRGH